MRSLVKACLTLRRSQAVESFCFRGCATHGTECGDRDRNQGHTGWSTGHGSLASSAPTVNRESITSTVGSQVYSFPTALKHHRDRRFPATLVVLLMWGLVSLLHWRPETQALIWGLTVILSIQAIRMFLTPAIAPSAPTDTPLPIVSILVPAKNESAVLQDLVHTLAHLNYPLTHLDIWVIDDGSTDDTPQLLHALQTQFSWLQVHRRDSKGGKSGALNAVLPLTRGEIVVIFDADAQMPPNFLRQVVPLLQRPSMGAVQVRKTLSNENTNFLTRCQQMELSCDTFLQTHRIAVGGMSELRGNGMLVRRELLEKCNGWSEDTCTDDLDLTFKLALLKKETLFVTIPAVQEEGVTTWRSLWLQHARWAEGGYQRYLDYWPHILNLGWAKELDLLLFFFLQFLLPIGLIPDLLWALFYDHQPILWSLQTLFSTILTLSFVAGLYQLHGLRGWQLLWATVQGFVYMLHWVPIMVLATLQLCVRSPRLRWVKTQHYGRTA